MKLYLFMSLTLMLAYNLAAQTSPQTDNKAILTTEQRAFATNYMQQTKQEFLKSIEGLTEEQLKFKAKEGKWCIMDCAEHIALAEQTLFSVTQKQLKEPADSLRKKHLKMTEKKIITRLTFRLIKVKAPEIIKPSGKFATIDAIKSAFTAKRDSAIAYVETTQDPLHTHFWKHPATGTIDLYQTIILMSAHTKRHILQIEEVKSNKGFPENKKAVKL
jgi:uncharacterized damage-inducible protein DinB